MENGRLQKDFVATSLPGRVFDSLAHHSSSVIMAGAILCTLLVKFYWACYIGRISEYLSWITADLIVLLGLEVILSLLVFFWPRKIVLRITLLTAAAVCTWSVFNAAWLLTTGTQILPAVLMPLFRDPVNRFTIIGHHLVLRPLVAVSLLGPSAVALAFFFTVLVRPFYRRLSTKMLLAKAIAYCILITMTLLTAGSSAKNTSKTMEYAELRYNSQLKAITSFFSADSKIAEKTDYSAATRKFPTYDELDISLTKNAAKQKPKNVVIVILEGIAYKQTSLYDETLNLTPCLVELAEEGVSFENARTPMTHTTKALFSILAGRFPSVSQDFVEAVPAEKNYAGLTTILRDKLGYRTAFFQSALGSFEARSGLVHNLGFETFWARNDLNDPNKYLGYLASDEFAIIEPITDWLRQDDKPFLLTLLCSVTHDPYEVPEWFGSNDKEPLARYRQTITYTDSFIKALDEQLAKLNLSENTIFCIVGDHGEAFGEHGRFGHARIPFDEGLRIVWLMRAPGLITPGQRITEPTSSIDVTPTILSAMGFDITSAGFNGIDMLNSDGSERKLFFSAWINQSPAGFILGDKKYIYDPINNIVIVYNLRNDPDELSPKEIIDHLSIEIASEITDWRNSCIIPLTVPEEMRQKRLFDKWLCRWKNREPIATYDKP